MGLFGKVVKAVRTERGRVGMGGDAEDVRAAGAQVLAASAETGRRQAADRVAKVNAHAKKLGL